MGLDVEGLLGMQSIEKVAYKPFFIGVLAMLLEFKVQSYEYNPDLSTLAKKLKQLHKHSDLLKEINPLVNIQSTYLTVVYTTITKQEATIALKELIDSFKLLKQVIYLRKGYFCI
jgi:hypothetical protein